MKSTSTFFSVFLLSVFLLKAVDSQYSINSWQSHEFSLAQFLRDSELPGLITESVSTATINGLSPWSFSSVLKDFHMESLKAFTTLVCPDERETVSARTITEDQGFCSDRNGEREEIGNIQCTESMYEEEDYIFHPVNEELAIDNTILREEKRLLWVNARKIITLGEKCFSVMTMNHKLSEALEIPEFMKYFDFSDLEWSLSGLFHLSDRGPIDPFQGSEYLARFYCVVEGTGTAISSQGDNYIQPSTQEYSAFYAQRDCFYIPKGWSLAFNPSSLTVILSLAWSDDLLVTESAAEALLAGNAEYFGTDSHKLEPPSLLNYLPKLPEKEVTFWRPEEDLDHLIVRYLSGNLKNHTCETFMGAALLDRLLVHALVTCDSYCQASLRRLYAAFDLNEDETLNPHDFEALTPQTLNELKHTIDDIVQDLREDSLDEWSESIEEKSATRNSFLQKANDQQKKSAQDLAKRIQTGRLSRDEKELLEKKMPELVKHLPK